MVFNFFSKGTAAMLAIIFFAGSVAAQINKQTYVPAKVWRVPDHNDYSDSTSEFSNSRKAESANIAIFWSKEFGQDPMQNPDVTKRFDTDAALKECERFYDFYVNKLKIVQKGQSLTDRYKILFYVIGGDEQTAFGGGAEDKIGILWTPAVRISKAPYGALAHELGHAFQYLASADSGTGFRGPIMEMSAQYMLWQVYPEWMTFENYHLKSFLKKTHFAFLHPENTYHSPYVLEYWSNQCGIDFFGQLLRKAKKGEDIVMTYKRMTSRTQEQFNDDMFTAARRFITWDMERIREVAAPYVNQHTTALDTLSNGWFRIAKLNCPENYGYNGIKLTVPAAGTTVSMDFKGIAGATGFRALKVNEAGWRYGFLAVQQDGSRVYSDTYADPAGTVTFKVPGGTAHLWLVVMGAPTVHVQVAKEDKNNPEWPYEFKLQNTGPVTK